MNNVSKPPPSLNSAVAAAAGGFVGALAGAIVAATIMSGSDDSDTQSALDRATTDQPVAVAER